MAAGGSRRCSSSACSAPRSPTPRWTSATTAPCWRCRAGRIAFTTDSFVISPLFFPGGDIGSLAVHGTVNDLAMCGARPLALTAAFVIEEGLAMDDLWRIVRSMAAAARAAGVSIVTGDTKVVDRGKGDGVFINTTGHRRRARGGARFAARARAPATACCSRAPSRSTASRSSRCARGCSSRPRCAPIPRRCTAWSAAMLDAAGGRVHVLRDPTRGGVSSALNEIAQAARVGIRLDESGIPIAEAVRGACEILGLDPLYVANEGKCLAIVAPDAADAVLAAMRAHPAGGEAADHRRGRSASPPARSSCAAASAASAWWTC